MKYDKKKFLDDLFRVFIVVVCNIVLSIATVWFLEPARLYAGGATGLAQLLCRIISKCGGHFNLGLMIFFVNVPFAIVGWKYVSHRFCIFSIMAIGVQSLATGLLNSSPFSKLSENIITYNAVGEMLEITNYGGILTLAIFGGLLAGFASGMALKFGTSTGGVDIIAQAVALHKGMSIGVFTMSFNLFLAIFGGGVLQGNWYVTLFTCVRLILNSLVTDKVHTSYTYTGLRIFTVSGEQIATEIMNVLNRGCTIFEGTGAYTHKTHTELYCVVSTYEVEKVRAIIRKYDVNAFVVMSPVRRVAGNFVKKTIV